MNEVSVYLPPYSILRLRRLDLSLAGPTMV
jgi:hypothetical protein